MIGSGLDINCDGVAALLDAAETLDATDLSCGAGRFVVVLEVDVTNVLGFGGKLGSCCFLH